MAFRLPSQHIEDQLPREDGEGSVSSSDDDNAEEETWEDWVSDSLLHRPCKSLFDDQEFPSVDAAIEHDKTAHNFNLEQQCARLGT